MLLVFYGVDNNSSELKVKSRAPLPRADVRIPVYLTSKRPNPQPNVKVSTQIFVKSLC